MTLFPDYAAPPCIFAAISEYVKNVLTSISWGEALKSCRDKLKLDVSKLSVVHDQVSGRYTEFPRRAHRISEWEGYDLLAGPPCRRAPAKKYPPDPKLAFRPNSGL